MFVVCTALAPGLYTLHCCRSITAASLLGYLPGACILLPRRILFRRPLMATHASPSTAPTAVFDPNAFNLLAPDQLNNPFPTYAQARRDQPVFYSPMFDMWFVTRYE